MVHLLRAHLHDAVLLAYSLYYDHRNKTGLRNAARLPNFPRVWRLVYLGLPAATQFGMEVGVFAVATALIGKLGAVPLASHQVALNTVSLTYMVPLGISAAAAVRVGQALGRRDAHGCEPRRLDGDAAGNELHGVHGASRSF